MAHDTLAVERLKVPVGVWLVVALLVALIYALTLDNGIALGGAARTLHEFFHDGRHFVGVPCH